MYGLMEKDEKMSQTHFFFVSLQRRLGVPLMSLIPSATKDNNKIQLCRTNGITR